MRISIVIPTYKRPKDLQRLLESVVNQLEKPEEVLVIVGPGDVESTKIASDWSNQIHTLRIVHATKPSVVHALNIGLKASKEDIVCLLDDDVWLPRDWSLKIKAAYLEDQSLGAYGGRDQLQIEDRKDLMHPPLALAIGMFRWDGSFEGNHHCGIKVSPAKVDVLKGCNLSFRRSALTPLQIDPILEGHGAEQCWEIDLCQSVVLSGYSVVYDNSNYVLHYPSVRLESDKRNDLFSPSAPAKVFNEAYVLGKFRPVHEVLFFCLRSFILGSRFKPGLIWSVYHFPKHGWKVVALPWRMSLVMLRGVRVGGQHKKLIISLKKQPVEQAVVQ